VSALRIAAIAIVAAIAAALTGCSAAPATTTACAPYAHGVVLVVGVHANEPAPDLTDSVLCRLDATVDAGGPVGAVAVDGSPRVLLPVQASPLSGDNPAAKQNSRNEIVGEILGAIQDAKPKANGSDLVAGLVTASDLARSTTPAIADIVVVDSGVTDTGLDLTVPGATLMAPQDVSQYLLEQHELRADQFQDQRLEFWGLGSTSAPQRPLSLAQRDAITAMWLGAVQATGGTAIAKTLPRGGAGPATRHTVKKAPVVEPVTIDPHAGDDLRFGDESIAFVADQAVVIDAAKAKSVLAPVAAWLAADRTRTAAVVGRTSSADPARNQQLSLDRANACIDLLVQLGAARDQLTAQGLGYTADPPDDGPQGFDPAAAALNRVVEVRLG